MCVDRAVAENVGVQIGPDWTRVTISVQRMDLDISGLMALACNMVVAACGGPYNVGTVRSTALTGVDAASWETADRFTESLHKKWVQLLDARRGRGPTTLEDPDDDYDGADIVKAFKASASGNASSSSNASPPSSNEASAPAGGRAPDACLRAGAQNSRASASVVDTSAASLLNQNPHPDTTPYHDMRKTANVVLEHVRMFGSAPDFASCVPSVLRKTYNYIRSVSASPHLTDNQAELVRLDLCAGPI